MTKPKVKQGLPALPGIGVSLLPKVACPLCWPAYAGLLSSVGLGFLLSRTYLLALTAGFLMIAVAALGYGARERRGYGPLALGLAASGVVLTMKFALEFNIGVYLGVGLLVVASLWNIWPRYQTPALPCCSAPRESVDANELKENTHGESKTEN